MYKKLYQYWMISNYLSVKTLPKSAMLKQELVPDYLVSKKKNLKNSYSEITVNSRKTWNFQNNVLLELN